MSFTKGITYAGIGAGGFYFASFAGKYSVPVRIASALLAAYGAYKMYDSLFGGGDFEPSESVQVGVPNATPGTLGDVIGEILSPTENQELGSGGFGSSTIPVTVKLINPTLSTLSGEFILKSAETELGFFDYGYSSTHTFSLGPKQAKNYNVQHPATNAFIFGTSGLLSLRVGDKLLDEASYQT